MKIQIGDLVRYNKKTCSHMYEGLPSSSFMIVVEINKIDKSFFKALMFPNNEYYNCRTCEVIKVKPREIK